LIEPECRIYEIRDYGYVGGYQGAANEEMLMREVYKNGPVEIAVFVGQDFLYYNSGVYIPDLRKMRVDRMGLKKWGVEDFYWMNHAVVLIGWGETEHLGQPLKYWVVRNSWGPWWGERGHVKILRGSGIIETSAEFLDPLIS
jgi:cathepsin C